MTSIRRRRRRMETELGPARRSLRRFAVASTLLTCLALGDHGGAAGQTDPEPVPLHLVDQSEVVDPDGVFVLRLDLDPLLATIDLSPPAIPLDDGGPSDGIAPSDTPLGSDDVQVDVRVFGRLTDRDQLDDTPTVVLNRLPPGPLSAVPVDGDNVMTIRVPVRAGAAFDDLDRIRLPDPGVYPVVVDVRVDGTVAATARTNLVRPPGPTDAPEDADADPDSGTGANRGVMPPVALVVDLDQPTALADAAATSSGDDAPNPAGPTDDVTTGGPVLDDVVELLAARPDIPVTVVVEESTIDLLGQQPDRADGVRQAIGERPVLVVPSPALDPSAVSVVGQADLYERNLAAARAAAEQLGLVVAPSTVTLENGQTTGGVADLIELGIDTALMTGRPPALTNPGSGTTGLLNAWVERGGTISTPTGSIDAVVPSRPWPAAPSGPDNDAGDGEVGPTVAARVHRVVAELALRPENVPVVLAVGGTPTADGEWSTLITALDRAGVDLVALDRSARSWAGARPELAALRQPAYDLTAVTEDLARSEDLLGTYDTFYLTGARSPARYREALLAVVGPDVSTGRRVDAAEQLHDDLSAELDVITLPDNQSVTLAAQSAPIPLTIASDASGDRQVLLQFRSDRIVVAEHGQLITVGPGTSSIDIEVQARSLGASPLQVLVMTPDGRHVLSTTRFQVRSTAVPGLGLAISALGLGVLGTWWYLSIRRSRSANAHPSGRRRHPDQPDDTDADLDRDEVPIGDSV